MLLHNFPADGAVPGPEPISVNHTSTVPNLMHMARRPLAALISVQETHAEHVRRWTSDQIDRGQFGVLFHPVTGNCLVGTGFDEARHCHVVEHQYSGWGENTAESECLPRIGDGKDHAESDFPLPHWKFHWKTRQPLQK